MLTRRGITRRQLVKFCSAMLQRWRCLKKLGQTVAAVSKSKKPVLVWLQFQDSRRVFRIHAAVDVIRRSRKKSGHRPRSVLVGISRSHMAGSGTHATAVLDRVVKEEKGKYLVVVEGGIPIGDGGAYCTVGGHTALEIAERVCRNAAVPRRGACAADGGFPCARTHPTGSLGVGEAVPGLRAHQYEWLPAQSREHGSGAGALPDLQRSARDVSHNRPLFPPYGASFTISASGART